VLAEVLAERGELDLEFLRALPLAEARSYLEGLPGVGPKTAACVLVFALEQPAIPVDTHVHRVARTRRTRCWRRRCRSRCATRSTCC
jgi:endonuclease-3